ncbi:MAG: hypothetical protein NTAFB05_25770 [Nitrobacter sp.]|uniref:hypothetical protein n=1 Tax=Nitrobacter sp. TaxID=29420 RepID=UPI00387DFFBB
MTTEAKPDLDALPHPYWVDGINDPKDTSRLVKRVKLSDLMNYDPRAAYKHKRLWEFHLGWAHKDYGWTSLASTRRIQTEMQARSPTSDAMSLQHIAAGNRDLVEWQYLFEEEKGKGHRGTRYSINWSLLELAANGQFPVSVHLQGDAISVHLIGDAAVTHVGDANSVSVHPVGDKDPTTKTRLKDGAISSSNSAASATPPHVAGLAPASGEAPQGFEEFWTAYAHKQQRAKAKAAWAKLDPSPELVSTIITEAGRWAAHYAEHAVEPRWRVLPHNWLAGENWLQDLPIVHKDAKSAAIANVRGRAKPASTTKSATHGIGANIKHFSVTGYTEEGSPFSDWFATVSFQADDGTAFSQRFHALSIDGDGPDLDAYNAMAKAVFGKGNPVEDWVGRRVGVTDDKGLEFWWLPPEVSPPPTPARRYLTADEAEREAFEAWCAEQDEAA